MNIDLDLFESWLPVVGYEGLYEVSDFGRVRSIARKGTPGRLLRLRVSRKDYLKAGLVKNNKHQFPYVHKLVLTAFISQRPPCHVCDHIDGNKQNNRVLNLRWVTHKQNVESSRERLGEWRTSEQAKRNWITRRANQNG